MAEPEYDVAVQVHKGANGYGIYFTQANGTIKVTKLDDGSEAQMAGVQCGDILYSVQDLDNVLPQEAPGSEVVVNGINYQQTLHMVRQMKYCRLAFVAGTTF